MAGGLTWAAAGAAYGALLAFAFWGSAQVTRAVRADLEQPPVFIKVVVTRRATPSPHQWHHHRSKGVSYPLPEVTQAAPVTHHWPMPSPAVVVPVTTPPAPTPTVTTPAPTPSGSTTPAPASSSASPSPTFSSPTAPSSSASSGGADS